VGVKKNLVPHQNHVRAKNHSLNESDQGKKTEIRARKEKGGKNTKGQVERRKKGPERNETSVT